MSNPYGEQNPYAQDQQQQYGQHDNYAHENYEMQSYNNNSDPSAVLSQQDFLHRVQDLRNQIDSFTSDLTTISQLHQRVLNSASGHDQHGQQLDQLLAQTQLRVASIKDGIKALEHDLARTTGGARGVKTTQLDTLRSSFRRELDTFRSLESDYRARYREQIARQYRIINPDADEHEVQQATEADWGNEGVFQAALRTNRTGQASSVLGNVRARHGELQRIEQTLIELAAIYQDLATVVEQQDVHVQAAEANAVGTVENLEKGTGQVEVGIKHARNRRKLFWWLMLVIFLIIAVIAIAVSVKICVVDDNCKSK
ncbi:t-SNARE [Emericellopsis atlantica]|uniref:t-SNARE n=1 Tax=Emericellopsis atlantica TaxID=2614577 RepID=A0A9P7ZL41_9HYPO|nr:t-SNARE [Emericellopsis atlantica]KAG9253473.1 t-SNARE [Emericellopsis atlantica]